MSATKLKQDKMAEAPKKEDKSSILNRVKSINLLHADKNAIASITQGIIENQKLTDPSLKLSAEKLAANSIKLSIMTEHPELYKYYKDMDYNQLTSFVDMSKLKGGLNDNLVMKVPENALATLGQGAVDLYGTSFSISPNSFWANVTNILNDVNVGDNFINTGESFNAWNFYRDSELASGEASLKTLGTTITGVCLLNQNQLVPANTQMMKGYQASLGVFINVDDAQSVGGGEGIGLFTMYSVPINVIKLAVTNPQQFAEMVRIFEATAVNTRDYSLWMITTYNLLSNITNIVVDNVNTNIRNCLNGTLFPAIQIMKNPTNEFNCGLIQTLAVVNTGTTSAPTYNWPQTPGRNITYEWITAPNQTLNGVSMNQIAGTMRVYSGQTWNTNDGSYNIGTTTASFNSPYMVPGNSTYPRIQCTSAKEMHLIVSPKFFVGLKSGTLSQLFHWEYQRLEEYIPPENIHMLYKQVNIPSGYLNDSNVENGDGTNSQYGYAYNSYASLGTVWFPDNVIYLVTKPADNNQWTASYGWVWTTEMQNMWGAGMIGTNYLQYAIYGGVLPWSNGVCFYFKNLMNLVSDQSQAVMYDFTLGTAIDQTATPNSTLGSGQD